LHRQFRSLSSKCDLYHEPNCIPWESDSPTIATLPDMSVVLHPEWHPAARVEFYEEHFERGMKQCLGILTLSDFSRRQIVEELGVPAERVTRTYCGVNPAFHPLPAEEIRQRTQKMGLPEDYLLYVGTLEPRKNLLMLLKAYCSLPANVRGRCPLVLVGGWGWNTEELAAYLEDEASSRGVMHLGYVPEEQLIALYGGARALLFPSFYEGFGLPPLEMMACGGAVMVSTAEALVEATGGRGHVIDPGDDDGWRSAMMRIIQDDEWRDHLRQDVVTWAKRFTWERCAEETLGAYRRCLGAPSAITMRSVD
jgi:alpha-1,3-rhamnosyl/mannosyltransferase